MRHKLVIVLLTLFITAGYINTSINAQDATATPSQACIALIGDSMVEGSTVFEVPGQGFPVIETPSIAVYMEVALREIGNNQLAVYDFSVGASSLTGQVPYTALPEYHVAQAEACQFVVIFPWINDLRGMSDPDFPESYVPTLAEFAGAFQTDTNTVIVMTYYMPVPSSLAEMIYNGSITPENVTALNDAILADCAPDGAFADVTCMDISELYTNEDADVDDTEGIDEEDAADYVMTTVDRTTYQQFGYRTARIDDADLLDTYWRDNPTGSINGDGVHLSENGKAILVEALLVFLELVELEESD